MGAYRSPVHHPICRPALGVQDCDRIRETAWHALFNSAYATTASSAASASATYAAKTTATTTISIAVSSTIHTLTAASTAATTDCANTTALGIAEYISHPPSLAFTAATGACDHGNVANASTCTAIIGAFRVQHEHGRCRRSPLIGSWDSPWSTSPRILYSVACFAQSRTILLHPKLGALSPQLTLSW
uniref:Uncharacterized protein n=1 Tax=Coccolithus braarudii TaxID=221442 RepID=A0A7S0LTM2_9EUKA|mmetsp:Transcript_6301/g.13763  ORF Transcript_6301/g.13763 Transcript_6301/m.13763 type:complete len:188 (+) Transcript_6301:542-1105(+)